MFFWFYLKQYDFTAIVHYKLVPEAWKNMSAKLD